MQEYDYSNRSPNDYEEIIPDPEQTDNMELTDDLKKNDTNEKGKNKEHKEDLSASKSDIEWYIHPFQRKEQRRQVDTVKFSADVPLLVMKGKSQNIKIQTFIDKLNLEKITWIDYTTAPKYIMDNKKELFLIITFSGTRKSKIHRNRCRQKLS